MTLRSAAIGLKPFVLFWGLFFCFACVDDSQGQTVILQKSGPDAPDVKILRDDRVATLELDYIAGNPWTPFDIGDDGLGPVGYRVSWASKRFLGRSANQKITSQRRIQIQPLNNNQPYFVRVEYVNRLGQIVGDYAFGSFNGGDESRVAQLRQEMTGFFDDFNEPAGLPDETRWNTTFSQTNHPDRGAFFINSQLHTHTLVGTPRMQLFGDRGQTTHRMRNRLRIDDGETRRIVFDIDGVNLAGRAIWYLDLVKEEAEITSHVTVGGGNGSSGHPSPGLRLSLERQTAGLFGFNLAGEQIPIEENPNLEWDGVQTFPNVRRSVEIILSQNHMTMLMDGVAILDSDLGAFSLEPGDYTLLWTAFGYNTMKVSMPYFLIHWDNFGFDGPASEFKVHNYRTQVAGTDLIRSDNHQPESVEIVIPDVLNPSGDVVGEARLVFTRQMNNWDAVQWSPLDTVKVGGVSFPIPEPVSNATPPLALDQLINTNAAYSTHISLGTVGEGGNAPLKQGVNQVTFEAAQCGFNNIHVEIKYPNGFEPDFTPPQDIHEIPLHHDFMKVGLPARISRIGNIEVDNNPWYSNFVENFNAVVSGNVEIEMLVHAGKTGSPNQLVSNFASQTLASAGENPGIRRVQLWIRPDNADDNAAILLQEIDTDEDVFAPQFAGSFTLDTTNFPNGIFELSVLAEDSRGIWSLPDFGGVGEQVQSADELNGFYYPLHITIAN